MAVVLIFPDGSADHESEVESKGWFADARLTHCGQSYRLNFYDPVRLRQDIEEELQRGNIFFEPNVVVVQSVTRRNMEKAAALLVQSGSASSLVADYQNQQARI